jgi:copper chaperone CopZ
MYKTIVKIDGMMCGMCEAHINDAIRKSIPEATKVTSSHKRGESSFLTKEKPDVTGLKDAIDKTGYTVLSIDTNTYTKKVFGLF